MFNKPEFSYFSAQKCSKQHGNTAPETSKLLAAHGKEKKQGAEPESTPCRVTAAQGMAYCLAAYLLYHTAFQIAIPFPAAA